MTSAAQIARPRGPKPHIGKAALAFLIADLLLWSFELVPQLVLPVILGATMPAFDMIWLLTPFIIIPYLAGPPALFGLGLHALIGQRLSRPWLLLALATLGSWWGIVGGETFLGSREAISEGRSTIPGLMPLDVGMLLLLMLPGLVWSATYVALLRRPASPPAQNPD